MKYPIILLLGSFLLGCEPSVKTDYTFPMPDDLKDCKVHRITNDVGTAIYVMSCPDKKCESTTMTGKHPTYTLNCA